MAESADSLTHSPATTAGGAMAPVFQEEPDQESSISNKLNAWFDEDVSTYNLIIAIITLVLVIGFVAAVVGWYKSLTDMETWGIVFDVGLFTMFLMVIILAFTLLADHMIGGVNMAKQSLLKKRKAELDDEEDEEEEEYYPPPMAAAPPQPSAPAEEAEEEPLEEAEEELEELEEEPDEAEAEAPEGGSGVIMPDGS